MIKIVRWDYRYKPYVDPSIPYQEGQQATSIKADGDVESEAIDAETTQAQADISEQTNKEFIWEQK